MENMTGKEALMTKDGWVVEDLNENKKKLSEASYTLSVDGLNSADADALSRILTLAGQAANGVNGIGSPMDADLGLGSTNALMPGDDAMGDDMFTGTEVPVDDLGSEPMDDEGIPGELGSEPIEEPMMEEYAGFETKGDFIEDLDVMVSREDAAKFTSIVERYVEKYSRNNDDETLRDLVNRMSDREFNQMKDELLELYYEDDLQEEINGVLRASGIKEDTSIDCKDVSTKENKKNEGFRDSMRETMNMTDESRETVSDRDRQAFLNDWEQGGTMIDDIIEDSEGLSAMYDNISSEEGLNPVDDFEKIEERMFEILSGNMEEDIDFENRGDHRDAPVVTSDNQSGGSTDDERLVHARHGSNSLKNPDNLNETSYKKLAEEFETFTKKSA